MGKAEIIEDLGSGHYTIKRVYSGRDAVESKVNAIGNRITVLQKKYSSMPSETEADILEKHIVKLQISSLQIQAKYFQNNFPEDFEVDAYCADHTEELSGEVGTIDIPGEMTPIVNIRPGYPAVDEPAVFNAERDGEFWPSIAVGPWTCFLSKCILPGWQKWKPLHRLAWIVSINDEDDTCSIVIQPTVSSQQNLSVNQGDGFDPKEGAIYQPSVALYPGFIDFCERNPGNPICSNREVGKPIQLSASDYAKISEINSYVNTAFEYESDASGYGIGEYFDIMTTPGVDRGDCEDYALTKMDRIISAGIVPAKNIQLIFCSVIGLPNGGHAVAGIQTTNREFIILDNRYDSLKRKYSLDSVYSWNAFQLAGPDVVPEQVLIENVPIEYMHCNSGAFSTNDSVIVEFIGQDWNDPKVIGFELEPKTCTDAVFFPEGNTKNHPGGRLNFSYNEKRETWSSHGNFTGDVPVNPASAGVPGIGLYLGGRIVHDPRVYSYYYNVVWNPPRPPEDQYDRYGPFPAYEYVQIATDNHLQYDVTAESWSIAQSGGLEAEDQNYIGLSNGRAIVHGGVLHEYWRKDFLGWWGRWHRQILRHYSPPWEYDWAEIVSWWFERYAEQDYPHGGTNCNWEGKIIYGNVEAYQVSTNSWAAKGTGPIRYSSAYFLIDDKMYIIGGKESGVGSCLQWNIKNPHEAPDFWGENPETDEAFFAWYYDDGTVIVYPWPVLGVNDVDAYDVITNSWMSKQGHPYGLREARGFSLIGRGYVGGGAKYEGSVDFCNDDVPSGEGTHSGKGFIYEPAPDTWTAQPCAPGLGGFCGGRWGNSELSGKTKGMRVGHESFYYSEEFWTPSVTAILNPISGTWGGGGSPYDGAGTEKTFGKGSLGAEC